MTKRWSAPMVFLELAVVSSALPYELWAAVLLPIRLREVNTRVW